MLLDYQSSTTIHLDRIQPQNPNSCRVSVLANAINFYTKAAITPEEILQKLKVDVQKQTIQDSQLDDYLRVYFPQLSLLRLTGKQYMSAPLWKNILKNQFILIINHQLLYTDPLNLRYNELSYLPQVLVKSAVENPEFSYRTFLQLYSFYLSRAKILNEGHMDLVLDLTNIKGREYVILANMASVGNENLIKIPFDFFVNYLCFDWLNESAISTVEDLPNETEMTQLRQFGFVKTKNFDFILGQIEIIYPISRRNELDQILL